jgi:AcrR family transcriptional regulator
MAHIRNSHSARTPAPARKQGKSAAPARQRPSGSRRRPASAHIRGRRLGQRSASPRTPRQRRAAETVEAIVTAAAQLLVERGYAAASTNAIAERAGVSIGSLYQYFRHKDDIFGAVVARHRQEVTPVVNTMLQRMSAPDADVVELTLELLRRMAEVNSKDPRLLAAIDRELGWLEHQQDDEETARQAVTVILRRRLAKQAYTMEVIATLIVAIVAPLSRWMVHSKPDKLDTDQFISAFGQMLRGLLG